MFCICVFSTTAAYILYIFLSGVRERSQEQCVRESCEAALLLSLHPRSSLTLVLQVLHDDGSVSFWKIPLLSRVATHKLSPLSCFTLTCLAAPVVLFERSLYDSDGRRPAYELPVLRSHLCHRQRRSNHNGPHCRSGEGRRNRGRQFCYEETTVLLSPS